MFTYTFQLIDTAIITITITTTAAAVKHLYLLMTYTSSLYPTHSNLDDIIVVFTRGGSRFKRSNYGHNISY